MTAPSSNELPSSGGDDDGARGVPSRSWIAALLRQRCPRCRNGPLFKTLLKMHDRCPTCGLIFERDPGYFVGAMYFGYGLGLAILVPLFFLLKELLPDLPILVVPTLALIIYLPLAPLVFRYSRASWIYFDRGASPGADEKNRDG